MEWIIWVLCIVILAILYMFLFPQQRFNRQDNLGYGLKDGPHIWTSKYNLIDHKHQSPVNIDSRLVRLVKNKRSMLSLAHFEEMPQAMHLKTTEHSIELWPSYPCCPPLVHWKTGAKAIGVYRLQHIAFRWSSEHTIDHQKYPLEIQSYFHLHKDSTSPPNSSDILAISNLFTESLTKNFYLEPICIHLNRIATSWPSSNSLQPIPPFPVVWMCPEFKHGFYQYAGSLTVPPCSETVTWFVNTELFSINPSQLNCFKSLHNTCGFQILASQRPVQPLNDRVILLNKFEG